MKNKNDQIFVRVMKNGYIQQLGICGPIPNPIKVSRALAHRMVVGGVEVHEVDPITKMTKKLTIHNVFSDEKNTVSDKETKPVQEAPVSKNEKPVETMTFVGTPVSEPEESETAVDKEVTEEDAEVSETEDAEKTDEITTHTSVKGKKKRK